MQLQFKVLSTAPGETADSLRAMVLVHDDRHDETMGTLTNGKVVLDHLKGIDATKFVKGAKVTLTVEAVE